MIRAMLRYLIAAAALLAPLAAHAVPPPASVVVAFDRETITPLIVEGLANKETGRPVAANDPVRIASISKLIMALAALRLVDEGKVDLDRDVSDYLGWTLRSPYHPDAAVTLAHLLSHRAGLSDAGGYVIPLGDSLAAKLADPASWRAVAEPGEAAFEYANLGSPLVATALEAASGERYDRLVERLVFAPLGVKACLNWTLCDAEMQERAVTLYRHTGEAAADAPDHGSFGCTIPVADGVPCDLDAYIPGTNASIFSPQGGVRIGMVDLAKIGQRLAQPGTKEFLSLPSLTRWLASFRVPEQADQEFFCAMGIGVQLIPAPGQNCLDDLFRDARLRIGHAGEAYALQSGLWFDLREGSGFAFFLTEAAPPPGGEDTGGFSVREKELMARAQALLEQ
jgi:CubicO group peptidase (beta-lactamase class C family)